MEGALRPWFDGASLTGLVARGPLLCFVHGLWRERIVSPHSPRNGEPNLQRLLSRRRAPNGCLEEISHAASGTLLRSSRMSPYFAGASPDAAGVPRASASVVLSQATSPLYRLGK